MHELDWEKLCRNLVVKEFKLYSELTQLRTFQRSPFLDEELSSCGVDLACRTVFVVKDNNKLFDDRKYRRGGIQREELALQNTQKSLRINWFIRIPSVPRRLFPFSLEGRCGIAARDDIE